MGHIAARRNTLLVRNSALEGLQYAKNLLTYLTKLDLKKTTPIKFDLLAKVLDNLNDLNTAKKNIDLIYGQDSTSMSSVEKADLTHLTGTIGDCIATLEGYERHLK